MKPTLSIIVPVYNAEDYLSKCIESILNQKYQDFELILVNDGASDSSGSICDEYADKDIRIKVIHKENGGQSSARNTGLNKAIGEYIGFVDSDDWIHEDMYSKLVGRAAEHKYDIVACNFYLMNKNGHFIPYNKKPFDTEYDRKSGMKEIYTNRVLSFSACNKIYRRDLFNDLRFIEGIIFEDLDIAYKLVYKSRAIAYIKECLYFYRYNENSTTRSQFTEKRLDEYFIREGMYKFYQEKYPNISEQVYYDFCKIRSYLFASALKSKIDSKKYKYLIRYDKAVLQSAMKSKDLNFKNKLELFLLINFPVVEVHIRSTWLRLRQVLLSVKNGLKRS